MASACQGSTMLLQTLMSLVSSGLPPRPGLAGRCADAPPSSACVRLSAAATPGSPQTGNTLAAAIHPTVVQLKQ